MGLIHGLRRQRIRNSSASTIQSVQIFLIITQYTAARFYQEHEQKLMTVHQICLYGNVISYFHTFLNHSPKKKGILPRNTPFFLWYQLTCIDQVLFESQMIGSYLKEQETFSKWKKESQKLAQLTVA